MHYINIFVSPVIEVTFFFLFFKYLFVRMWPFLRFIVSIYCCRLSQIEFADDVHVFYGWNDIQMAKSADGNYLLCGIYR